MKTIILLASLTALLMWAGQAVGCAVGLWFALVLAAVIAQELGHIKHRDTLIMAVAATFAGALSMLANSAMLGSDHPLVRSGMTWLRNRGILTQERNQNGLSNVQG